MNEVKEYLDYRCSIYFWLKSLYISEPRKVDINEIVDVCRKYDESQCPEGEGKFISFFSNLDKRSTSKLSDDIRVEYARLFLGPKHVLASPYESVYRSSSKSIFGQSCIEVNELYKRVGMEIRSMANIPADFIGYELEFMYYLAYESVKAIEEENLEQVSKILNYGNYFVEEHLSKWIVPFTDKIKVNTNMKYFQVLADFTKEFILNDYELISKLVNHK